MAGSCSPFYPEALASAAFGRSTGDMQAADAAAHAAFDAARNLPPVSARRPLAIRESQQAGAWTPLWVTIRTLVELLARAGAWHDAATLYGAVTSASSGAPPFGADADRLRQRRRCCASTSPAPNSAFSRTGEQMDGGQVIQFALQAIARAATKA